MRRAIQPAIVTQILTVARRRKWIIIGAVGLCLLAGVVLTMLATPKYTASTVIEIQRETGSFINVEGAEQKSGYLDQEFYQTQYGLLQSDTLARRVASDLRLADDAAFLQKMHIGPPAWFNGDRINPRSSTREERNGAVGNALLRRLNVNPERLSRLVTISMTTPDAALSQKIVDKWANDFIQVTLERRYGATAYARRFLEQRLVQLRNRIDDSERQLVEYARSKGIVNLPAIATGGANGNQSSERSLAGENLAALNTELVSATADRVRAGSRLSGNPSDVTEALNNPTISSLREKRAELSADYAKLMTQFEPGYPAAVALRNQIDQIDRSIAREQTRITSSLRTTYDASIARQNALQARVNAAKAGVLDFRQRSIKYNILQRDADTNRQLYDALLQRYKEIGVAGGIGVNNISIVDPPELPTVPSSPNLILNLALATALGLLLGIGGALIAEQMDQAIVDPGEVESALGAPLIGTIPKTSNGNILDVLQDRKSAINEAYLSLQTNLAFATSHGMPRSIAVTSTRPGEGKSTTSYALALSIARSSHRVILVDGDMRSPSVQSWLGQPNRSGLSNYLSGNDNLSELIHPTELDNFSIMMAGPQPPSAPELLSGNRMESLIEELSSRYDHIVFDAPPVMGLADSPLICSRVEGTLFVLEASSTQLNMARVALNRLQAAHAALIGVVLTKFDARRGNFGYGYDYGYGYGYGQKDDAQA